VPNFASLKKYEKALRILIEPTFPFQQKIQAMLLTKSEKREFVFLSFFLFLTAVSVIWVRTATVKGTYRYVQAEKEFRRLREATQSDRVEWLRMTSPRRLEKVATHLGLSAPTINQVLRYHSKGQP
jgi:hypothetical protein